jgi:hypothetical protein
MASAGGDKRKEFPEDDPLNPNPVEEVMEEAEEEEGQAAPLRATIASIRVVKPCLKRNARMRTGGKVLRHCLAPRMSTRRSNNPFHTLFREYEYQKVAKANLPSAWDIDRSNSAEKKRSEAEEGWGNNSKSWDSPTDRLMSRVEQNSELIRNLSFNIEDLTALVNRMIKDFPPPAREE